MEINGTLIWYYNVCKREVWLMSRKIVPDQNDTNLDLGRFLHQQSYNRNKKEISFGNVKFDVIFRSKDKLVIGETKKSSKYFEASKWQLLFYLKTLKEAGIYAEGVFLYPEERKRVPILLDEDSESKLTRIKQNVEKLCNESKPEKVKRIPYCKKCAYREYCFS